MPVQIALRNCTIVISLAVLLDSWRMGERSYEILAFCLKGILAGFSLGRVITGGGATKSPISSSTRLPSILGIAGNSRPWEWAKTNLRVIKSALAISCAEYIL